MFRWRADRRFRGSLRSWDRPLEYLLRACGAISAVLVLWIAAFLLREAWPAAKAGLGRFVSDPSWHPAPVAEDGLYGLTPMVAGTLAASAGALLLATPLGVLAAVFCRFYAPPLLAGGYRRLIELLAGIPSVVYGFWGLVVLVPLIRELAPPGPSLLAGVLILTLMILPTVALQADAAFAAVPGDTLRAAAALGLSRSTTIADVVLPAARSGVSTGVLLAAGRAIGETMAVLMVCGNLVQMPGSFFDPIRTLTANIALEMAYALGDHRSALFVSGVVLMVLAASLVAASEWSTRSRHA